MSLKQKAISGAKWTSISKIFTALVGILRISILTRVLEKEDFGIVAILTVILGLTQVFSDLGFSVSVMSRKDISRKEFSSIYWFQIVLYAFIAFIIILLSPYIAKFYKEDNLVHLIPIVLIDLVFWGVGKLYDTLLQKDFQFKILALRNIITSIVSLFVAVGLAYSGFGVYSLVISTITHTALLNIWNFILGQKIMPIQFYFSYNELKPSLKIGVYQTGTQILDYFSSRLDIMIIGKFFGADVLGVYHLAKDIVLRIMLIVSGITNRVVLPFFAMKNNDDEFLRVNFCKLIHMLSLLLFPICAFIGVFSKYIVMVLYGEDYLETTPLLMSIFSLYAMSLTVRSPIGNLSVAKGRTDINFNWTKIRIVIAPIFIVLASFHSIEMVAFSQFIYTIVTIYLAWKMLIHKLIRLPFIEYFKSYSTMYISSITCVLVLGFIVVNNYFQINGYLMQVIVYGLMFITLYIFPIIIANRLELMKIMKIKIIE